MVIFFGRLRVPGNGINSIAWEGSSMRMALAVDSFIYFADIQPEYQWACIDDVLVYAFAMPGKDEKMQLSEFEIKRTIC